MQSSIRRSERIDYRVPVALFSGTGQPLIGRSRNVSTSGIRVDAPEALAKGAALRCELTLDGRRVALDGHVVWSCEARQGSEAGIRFEHLGREEADLLRHLVDCTLEGYRPMQLRFGDVPDAVTARACMTELGVLVSAPLPMMDHGRQVAFSFEDGRGPFHGTVADVQVYDRDGSTRMQILLDVESRERVRIERHTMHGYVVSAPEPSDAAPPGRRPRARQLTTPVWRMGESGTDLVHTTQPEAPAEVETAKPWRKPSWGTLLLALLAALLVGAALGWLVADAAGDDGDTREPDTPRPVATAPAAPSARSAAQPAEAQANAATTAALPREPAGTAASDRGEAGRASTTSPLAPAPSAGAPVVTAAPGAAVVALPFEGSLDGMESHVWADPAALIVQLPAGTSELAPGNYPLRSPALSRLQLEVVDGALLARLFSRRPIGQHAVEHSDGMLRLRVAAH